MDTIVSEKEWAYYEYPGFEVFSKRGKGDKERPQDRAFEFADERGGLPVFGKHIKERAYAYVVSGWNTFFSRYIAMPPEDRVFTEIIRPGVPVNFYVDAELMREANPGFEVGGEKENLILQETRRVCKEGILRNFPHIREEDVEVCEMDSSNPAKLSRHLIFRIKGRALEDHTIAKKLYQDIANSIPEDSILKVIDQKSGNKVHFLDGSVYSKNRQFRIYQSHKYGNYRFLHFPGVDSGGERPNSRLFWKSLITFFPSSERRSLVLLQITGTSEKRKRTTNDLTSPKKPRLKGVNQQDHWLAEELKGLFDVETYKVEMEEDGTTIKFSVLSRFCEMIGKEHISNHVQWVFNLVTKTYEQNCYKCKRGSGNIRQIPERFHASIAKYMESERCMIDLFSMFDF